MRVTVLGLWHLGSVTAACLAAAGHDVVGLDTDDEIVGALRDGRAPLFEPGLDDLVGEGLLAGRLRFSSDPADAFAGAQVVWVTIDTPVSDDDEADSAYVRAQIEAVQDSLPADALLLVSSQVPAGFTRAVAADLGVRAGYSPENLRLGKAIEVFCNPERVVVGVQDGRDRERVARLLEPFTERIEWMSIESAEMTKHALNGFLATSVTFANELARLCEQVGADAKEVERGLKSEGRIGPRAYLAPGAAFAGGTLARDVRYLQGFGRDHGVATPFFDGLLKSNEAHKRWVRDRVGEALDAVGAVGSPVVAVLGLTYKPGTSTLRRSLAVELCTWLADQGVTVQAYDPGVEPSDPGLPAGTHLRLDARAALKGADVAIVATEWPDFAQLTAEDIVASMRAGHVIDQNWFLAAGLAGDPRITYVATGRGRR